MAALHNPSASFLQVFLPVARASLLPSATVTPHPLLQQLQRRANNALLKTSFLAGVLLPIPGLLKDLWDGLLNAVPKKKTSHMKKRHRQMAGKALKDVTALNKCSSCGRLKRAHVLCPYCVMSIKRWFGNGFKTPADIEQQAADIERRALLDLPNTASSTEVTSSNPRLDDDDTTPLDGVLKPSQSRYMNNGSWQKRGLRVEDSTRFQTDRPRHATEARRHAGELKRSKTRASSLNPADASTKLARVPEMTQAEQTQLNQRTSERRRQERGAVKMEYEMKKVVRSMQAEVRETKKRAEEKAMSEAKRRPNWKFW